MIVFVPSYDLSTVSNCNVARRMNADSCVVLLAEDATRTRLHEAFSLDAQRPLFAMSHGSDRVLFGQQSEPSLLVADAEAMRDRHLFVFACSTATRLGPAASEVGATYWGYLGTITAPSDEPQWIGIFVELFSMLRQRFSVVASFDERKLLFEDLAERCQSYTDSLEPDAPTEVRMCLLNLWQRLRVYVPDAPTPEQHPEAPPPVLSLMELL